MRFTQFKKLKKAECWEEGGFKIRNYVENLSNGAFDYAIEYARENDFKGVISFRYKWVNCVLVRFCGDSAWIYSQSEGRFIERVD